MFVWGRYQAGVRVDDTRICPGEPDPWIGMLSGLYIIFPSLRTKQIHQAQNLNVISCR
jgi:hypothetical protein